VYLITLCILKEKVAMKVLKVILLVFLVYTNLYIASQNVTWRDSVDGAVVIVQS
jgi:hypothetical protein